MLEILSVKIDARLTIEQWSVLESLLIKDGLLHPVELELLNHIKNHMQYEMTLDVSDLPM